MPSKHDGQKDQHDAEILGLVDESNPEANVEESKSSEKSVKMTDKTRKKTCELSGEEVRGIYGAFRGLHEHTNNNPNASRGDLTPLVRELAKIGWKDCTDFDDKGACKNGACQGGLHN